MPEIHEEIIGEVYRSFEAAPHSRARDEVLYEGVRRIMFRLNRYKNDPEKLAEKSKTAISELESILNRFYYSDTEFKERLLFEAKAYTIEIGPQ
ncbi:MAG: hypothetical protein JXQ30_02570 [Spirochaetes bacterium]|nr:hypothetical protein [Spirochaetota bacterium]